MLMHSLIFDGILVGASILFATYPAASFQPAPSAIISAGQSGAPSHPYYYQGNEFGRIVPLRFSSSDEDEGYEVRGDAGGSRPETTFGAENVPVEQRPSNEYLNLIRQPTFGWASQESGDEGLAARLAIIYAGLFILVCYPISGATWVNDGYLVQKLTASNVGALSVIIIIILRLYSGWGYIGSRLKSKVIEYEETGWYDGDFEEKSEAEKARDLFLYRSNVRPVEDRLKMFALAIGGAWVASCFAFNIATASKPLFDQYDPSMLGALSYDDKIAGVVAEQSNGKPTYCDNRYYRAVANGGQGCN